MIGQTFGGYRIDALIGRGGMGVVYRAEQVALGRPVALKVIAPEFSADPDFRRRFDRESRTAASIDHPNVVPIYEAGEVDGTAFLAMRFVDGVDLRSILQREGRLSPARTARIVAQAGAALDAAHARGLVHRDVKPGNILITGDLDAPHAYLTDFGLTKDTASQSGLTATGHWMGTLDYVAPEQVEGKPIDARADVYSLGCVVYEVLTGRVPFPKESDIAKLYAHAHEPPPRVSDADPQLPAALDDVVHRALAKDPDQRFPSTGDLARAVEAAVEGEAVEAPERSVAAGAAAPPGPPSQSGTRLDPAPPPVVAAPPQQPAGWTPTTQQLPERGGRGALALALVAAAVLIAGAAVAVALIATGGSERGSSTTSTITQGENQPAKQPKPAEKKPSENATRFSTPRDQGQPYRAAYCRTRSGQLYCWTPDDGFTLSMGDGVPERASDAEEKSNESRAPRGYPTLAFDETRKIGDYTCTSRRGIDGLTCESPSGYSFQMPRYNGCPEAFGPNGESLGINYCDRPK